MNDSQIILKIIVEKINEVGLTEKDCLKSCGIGLNFLTDWKSGKSKFPSYDKIVKLSQYLNIDLDYLFLNKKASKYTFTKSDIDFINKFKTLNDIDQKRILKQIDSFLQDYTDDEIEVKNAETA